MDETYIKVGGKDRSLYRAVDKYGDTIDFLLKKEGWRDQPRNSWIKPLVIMENLVY